MPKEAGVYNKSIQSGKWFMISIISQRLINLVVFFVLARLLFPQDYGVITVVFTITNFLDSFLTPGFGAALLQKKENIDEHLNTVWTFELLKSILTAVVIFLAGNYIGRFFKLIPSQVLIIKLSGLLPILSSLGNIYQLKFFKELEYKKIFFRDVSGQLAYTVVSTVVALFVSPTAWALFIGYLASYFVSAITTYVLYPVFPRISTRFSSLKSLFGYGKWVYGQNILDFFTVSIDKIFVGRLLDPTGLGFYSRAKDLPSTITAPIGGLLNRVGFSAYVKVQDRLDKIQEGFLKSLDIMLLVSIPFSLLLLFEGGSIVHVLLGSKWMGIVVPLKIFSTTNIFVGLMGVVSPIFNAIGKPDINFKIKMVQLIISPPIFYFAIKFLNLRGAAIASLAVSLLLFILTIVRARSILKLDKKKFYPSVVSVLGASLGTSIVALPAHFFFHKFLSNYVIFIWVVVLGLIYLVLLFLIGKKFSSGPYHTVRSIINELGWSKFTNKIPWFRKKKKIVATIEARMTSSRLPGKVLMPLAGRPSLERLIERLKRSKYVDVIVVATTVNKADDPIVSLAERLGINYFRGSESDVLGRVLGAARSVQADIIVEVTGDCPLVDHDLVDQGIKEFFINDVDYSANIIPVSYPIGFDVQVFPVQVLAEVDKLTNDPLDRVHVSYYIYNHPERYRLHSWTAKDDYYWPELRVTLDEKGDYLLLNEIFERLLPINNDFTAMEVIQLLKNNPKLLELNQYVKQKDALQG